MLLQARAVQSTREAAAAGQQRVCSTAEPPKLLWLSHLYQAQLAATQGTLPTLLAWFGWAELALSAADVREPALLLVLRRCP